MRVDQLKNWPVKTAATFGTVKLPCLICDGYFAAVEKCIFPASYNFSYCGPNTAHTHARTHARTHAHAHTHTHTQIPQNALRTLVRM